MANKAGAVLERPADVKAGRKVCVHHWIIEPALGPTSRGKCRRCAEERTFFNVVDDSQPKEGLGRFFEKFRLFEDESDIDEQPQ